MTGSFRDAELKGWSARSDSYDLYLAPITNQVAGPIIGALGTVAGKSVLDVCCGPGHLAGALAQSGASVVGLDFATPMVVKARENYPRLNFHQGDAEALPFDARTFDHVVCAFGVMHLSNADAAISEAFRVLRPTGRYIFTQWAQDDELLGIVLSAIAEHGDPVADLPAAPPPMRFSDPLECRRVLDAVGFDDIRIERVETAWTEQQPAKLIDLVYGGAVRAAMVLEAQPPTRRDQIHRALLRAADARTSGGVVTIRRPVVMASGVKPPQT
jgi:ubiquinone/menaquinone biosynthesis C-methylase UbiE